MDFALIGHVTPSLSRLSHTKHCVKMETTRRYYLEANISVHVTLENERLKKRFKNRLEYFVRTNVCVGCWLLALFSYERFISTQLLVNKGEGQVIYSCNSNMRTINSWNLQIIIHYRFQGLVPRHIRLSPAIITDTANNTIYLSFTEKTTSWKKKK